MHLRHALVPLSILVVLFAFACGGDGEKAPDATSTPAGTIVTSDDGAFSLSIPNGAMPEGTDVSITSVEHDQLPVELSQLVGSGTGYQLEPDGLTFSQPATATLTLDRSELDDPEGTQSAYALVSFNETAGREVLDSDTNVTVGEDTVNVSAQIGHFSYVTMTSSALKVELLQVDPPIREVGDHMFPHANVINTRPAQVTLTAVKGQWFVGGSVTFLEGDIGALPFEDLNAADAQATSNTSLLCAHVGTGSYSFSANGVSELNNMPGLDTKVSVTADAVVECVEVGADTPQPPAPTVATPGASVAMVTLKQTGGCDHDNPGVSSKIQKRGKVTDADGNPVPGVTVEEEAQGDGLIDVDGQPLFESTASAVTDANGEFSLEWDINKVKEYLAVVQDVTLADGTPATLDPSSTMSTFIEVGAVCATPAPP